MPDINKQLPAGWIDVYAELSIPIGTPLLIQNKDSQQLLVQDGSPTTPLASDVSGPVIPYGRQYLVTAGAPGCFIRGRLSGSTGSIGIIANVQEVPE